MASSIEYCAYCFTETDEISDARKLPCGHIFCLECMLSDTSNFDRVRCITCRQEHEGLDVRTIDSCSIGKKHPNCDVWQTGSQAEAFCMTCSKNMCKEHAEMHGSFNKLFGFAHMTRQTGIMSEVISAPGKRLCDTHNEEIRGACSGCKQLLCFKCLAEIKCTHYSDQWHKVIDVHEVSSSYKENLNDKMTKLWKRISDIDELEKKANCRLAEELKNCENMKHLLEEVLMEQHTLMAEKTEKIKLAIDLHYARCENEVAQYAQFLHSSKQDMEQHCKDIQVLKRKSDYDIALNCHKMTDKSGQLLSTEMDFLKLENEEIYRYGKREVIENEVETPMQLKLQISKLEAELKVCRANLEKMLLESRKPIKDTAGVTSKDQGASISSATSDTFYIPPCYTQGVSER